MTLSDKIGTIGSAEYLFIRNEEPTQDYDEVIEVKNIKEFIKELKEEIDKSNRDKVRVWELQALINKLAGEELI